MIEYNFFDATAKYRQSMGRLDVALLRITQTPKRRSYVTVHGSCLYALINNKINNTNKNILIKPVTFKIIIFNYINLNNPHLNLQ